MCSRMCWFWLKMTLEMQEIEKNDHCCFLLLFMPCRLRNSQIHRPVLPSYSSKWRHGPLPIQNCWFLLVAVARVEIRKGLSMSLPNFLVAPNSCPEKPSRT
uniref:(northern house mosquito) hypothetical protein n=1 Tax=Culex pipiens TaxID=7175 RepID=A0A8D8BEC9_CULPI